MEDAFKARERALENQFFHAVDQSLLQSIRDENAGENCRKKLSQTTGISNVELLDELVVAGIQQETIVAFVVLPLARVAWADGEVDDQESEVVLNTAVALGCATESAGLRLLASWLKEEPDDKLFEVWCNYASHITGCLSSISQRDLASTIIRRSRTVAHATGGMFGIRQISPAERQVITQIQAALTTQTEESDTQ